MLSDGEIGRAISSGEIAISSKHIPYIGPSSIDLHLDNKAKIMSIVPEGIRVDDDNFQLFKDYDGWEEIVIAPGMFYLLSTEETITLADDIGCSVYGRSSIGRLGINIHTAGFVDIGFSGTITLEVSNFTKNSISIPKDTRICQIAFYRSVVPAQIPYGKKRDAKYHNQSGPTITKASEDYTS
jgi:dCTP deaminase